MASECLLYSIVNYGVDILRLVYLLHTETNTGPGRQPIYIHRRAHNNSNNSYVLSTAISPNQSTKPIQNKE